MNRRALSLCSEVIKYFSTTSVFVFWPTHKRPIVCCTSAVWIPWSVQSYVFFQRTRVVFGSFTLAYNLTLALREHSQDGSGRSVGPVSSTDPDNTGLGPYVGRIRVADCPVFVSPRPRARCCIRRAAGKTTHFTLIALHDLTSARDLPRVGCRTIPWPGRLNTPGRSFSAD